MQEFLFSRSPPFFNLQLVFVTCTLHAPSLTCGISLNPAPAPVKFIASLLSLSLTTFGFRLVYFHSPSFSAYTYFSILPPTSSHMHTPSTQGSDLPRVFPPRKSFSGCNPFPPVRSLFFHSRFPTPFSFSLSLIRSSFPTALPTLWRIFSLRVGRGLFRCFLADVAKARREKRGTSPREKGKEKKARQRCKESPTRSREFTMRTNPRGEKGDGKGERGGWKKAS